MLSLLRHPRSRQYDIFLVIWGGLRGWRDQNGLALFVQIFQYDSFHDLILLPALQLNRTIPVE